MPWRVTGLYAEEIIVMYISICDIAPEGLMTSRMATDEANTERISNALITSIKIHLTWKVFLMN